jgi:hypothetical protein
LGVEWSANAVLIVFNPDVPGDRCPIYWGHDEESEEAQASTECLKPMLAQTLRNLFFAVSDAESKPASLILPALGTGSGGLQKADFYEVFTDELIAQLRRGSDLPGELILRVWQGDRVDWAEEKEALAAALARLHTSWSREEHPQRDASSLYIILGVLLALLLVVALYGWWAPLSAGIPDLRSFFNAAMATVGFTGVLYTLFASFFLSEAPLAHVATTTLLSMVYLFFSSGAEATYER